MTKEFFFKCPHVEYPTVNVVDSFIINEIQIHQGSSVYFRPATLDGDMERDVISMSRKQAIAVAYKILELTDGK